MTTFVRTRKNFRKSERARLFTEEQDKKLWNKLVANKRDNKRLEKEILMRKVVKHHPRKVRKYLGFSQINYDNI